MAKKVKWEDDGRVIAPMTGEEVPKGFYQGRERKKNLKNGGKADITKKERRALTRAFFLVMLPKLLIVLGCFALVGLMLYFLLI